MMDCQERAVRCGCQLMWSWMKQSLSCRCLLQVPDVSGMIHTSDFPCLRVSEDVPDTDKRDPDIKVHTSQHLPALLASKACTCAGIALSILMCSKCGAA
jgi:hypothetical protein